MIKAALTFLLLATGFVLWNRDIVPCEKPVAYTLGTFDNRFDISQSDLLSALKEAEAVWEAPSGRELFAYDPKKADLNVNLVYDYRQEVTEELSVIEDEVEKGEAGYRALESEHKRVKSEYEALKGRYDAEVRAFDERSAAYEEQVNAWNKSDWTSRTQFEALEAEKEALNAEIASIKALEGQLNLKVRELNLLVDRLNRLARELNLDVSEYNAVGASRGETFAGGIYYSGEDGQGIDIYQFESRDKLVRILAHELGHALGLEHIDDPQAIMYHLNEGKAGIVTATDLAALDMLCSR